MLLLVCVRWPWGEGGYGGSKSLNGGQSSVIIIPCLRGDAGTTVERKKQNQCRPNGSDGTAALLYLLALVMMNWQAVEVATIILSWLRVLVREVVILPMG